MKDMLMRGAIVLALLAGSASAMANEGSDIEAKAAWHRDATLDMAVQTNPQAVLHDRLAVRPDQESAWLAFAVAANPQPCQCGSEDAGALPAPRQLERRLLSLEKQKAQLGKELSALKELYSVLSPDQRKMLDQWLVSASVGPQGLTARQ